MKRLMVAVVLMVVACGVSFAWDEEDLAIIRRGSMPCINKAERIQNAINAGEPSWYVDEIRKSRCSGPLPPDPAYPRYR